MHRLHQSPSPSLQHGGTWHTGPFHKKSKQRGGRGGLRIYFFDNPHPPWKFSFFTLPLQIPDKTILNPWILNKIVLDPLEISRPKTKTPGNSTLFFLVTLGNSTSFLINPWPGNFTCYFFDNPGNSVSSNPVWMFSWITLSKNWQRDWNTF